MGGYLFSNMESVLTPTDESALSDKVASFPQTKYWGSIKSPPINK